MKSNKELAVERYMLHPEALTELVAALDEIKGFNHRNDVVNAYLQEIHIAEGKAAEQRAVYNFGNYIYSVLYTSSSRAIEDDWEGINEDGLTEAEFNKLGGIE